jgi:hypothetical protein
MISVCSANLQLDASLQGAAAHSRKTGGAASGLRDFQKGGFVCFAWRALNLLRYAIASSISGMISSGCLNGAMR